MDVQKSFADDHTYEYGTLYLVGTPIGNLADVTERAAAILRTVDYIAAEDTRQTQKLLHHLNIEARLLSYHEHNEEASGPELIRKLQQGQSIALVSDAGMPAISDPGYKLVQLALAAHIHVVPIPGANAAITALIASGLPTDRFLFVGFLPRDRKERSAKIAQLKDEQATIILYEAPHRLLATLEMMQEAWGGERRMVIARELTKKFEEFARGTIAASVAMLRDQKPRGEYCLIIEGEGQQAKETEKQALWWSLLSLEEHIEHYEQQGDERKEAMRKVAQDRRVSRRDVYNKWLANRKKNAPR